jgi:hypothetical protein
MVGGIWVIDRKAFADHWQWYCRRARFDHYPESMINFAGMNIRTE